MISPIEFARTHNAIWSPCYGLVAAWLRHNGVNGVPSDSAARKLWFGVGPENGLAEAAKTMGLVETDKYSAGSVAVIKQPDAEPLLAIVGNSGVCVAKAFGVLFVGKPEILRCWRLPWVVS